MVFPPADNISAALTYKSNHIAIPDETYYIELDDTEGKDYMCILYSKEALDISNIIKKIKLADGIFYDKVKFAFADNMVLTKDVRYMQNNISFSTRTERTVVPIIVEINHK